MPEDLPRVLIIGLDAATPRLVERWVDEGRLPNLARFLKDGAYGEMLSVPNRNSAPAWSSMVTGLNPGKHGIYWFTEDDPVTYSYKFVNGSFRRGKAFWRILSDEGHKVGIMNVPLTFPAEQVNGVFVAGMDSPSAHDPRFTHPPELRDEVIAAAGGEYYVQPGLAHYVITGEIDEGIKRLHKSIDKKAAVAKKLMTENPWDVFMVVFTESDVVKHFFWQQMEDPKPTDPPHHQTAVRDTYEHLDRMVGELMETAPPDTTYMVVSDHGARYDDGLTRTIPSWLEHLGLLTYKTDEATSLVSSLVQTGASKTFRLLDKRLSPEARHKLARTFPALRRKVEVMMSYAKVDWSRTKAYTDGKRPEIWINLKGRQQEGIVDPSEYEEVRQKIIDALTTAVGVSTGEALIRNVHRREEAYSGPFVDRSPDLVIEWMDSKPDLEIRYPDGTTHKLTKDHLPDDPFDTMLNGGHDSYGMVALMGPGVKPGRINDAKIADVAPTVLFLRDAPIPSDVDGKVLKEALADDLVASRSGKTGGSGVSEGSDDIGYTEDEEAEIHERLRALGYVD